MLVKKERRRVSGGDGGTDMNERLAAALEQLPFWPNLTEPQREFARRGARLAQYDRGALVHGVEDGLLLASPGIFRAFIRRDGAGQSEPGDAAKRLQREVDGR